MSSAESASTCVPYRPARAYTLARGLPGQRKIQAFGYPPTISSVLTATAGVSTRNLTRIHEGVFPINRAHDVAVYANTPDDDISCIFFLFLLTTAFMMLLNGRSELQCEFVKSRADEVHAELISGGGPTLTSFGRAERAKTHVSPLIGPCRTLQGTMATRVAHASAPVPFARRVFPFLHLA